MGELTKGGRVTTHLEEGDRDLRHSAPLPSRLVGFKFQAQWGIFSIRSVKHIVPKMWFEWTPT